MAYYWEVQLNHPMDEEKVLENYILPMSYLMVQYE
jgi:hypothetical protein